MANLKLKNPSGGSLNFVSADGASDLTVTFPATTGTAMVSGNMPAFSAYPNTGTSVATATQTKVTFDVENFDTNSYFSSSRFTPLIAGYYQITASIRFGSSTLNTGSAFILHIYKNGSVYQTAGAGVQTGGFVFPSINGLVYCNGSSDYIEIYAYQNSGSTITLDTGTNYIFSGFMARAA